jgi:hypothetical protein
MNMKPYQTLLNENMQQKGRKSTYLASLISYPFLPSQTNLHTEKLDAKTKGPPAKPFCSQLKYERQTLTLILALPSLIPLATITFHSWGMAINTTIHSLVLKILLKFFFKHLM